MTGTDTSPLADLVALLNAGDRVEAVFHSAQTGEDYTVTGLLYTPTGFDGWLYVGRNLVRQGSRPNWDLISIRRLIPDGES